MTRLLIDIHAGVTRHPAYRLAAPLDFTLEEGVSTAILGLNGSGKSLLTAILTGAHPCLGDAVRYNLRTCGSMNVSRAVRLVTFRDVYGGSEPSYYQQRWNTADEQTFPTVREALSEAAAAWRKGESTAEKDNVTQSAMIKETGITEHLDKPVNQLSSGELRRLQLSKMLLSQPEVLIIDNPYIGLDKGARAMLTRVLHHLAHTLTLVLVVSREEDIPPFVHSVVRVEGKVVKPAAPYPFAPVKAEETGLDAPTAQHSEKAPQNTENTTRTTEASPLFFEEAEEDPQGGNNIEKGCEGNENKSGESVIDFRHITIRYGRRTILDDLTWEVKRGEHWALTGENGAGKSTLLSLVCADNPQGYACDIRLFGHRRGTGESIWDIKRRIGYVSPEIYSTYKKNLPALDIVASGLHDTIGLYKRPTDDERALSLRWMEAFGAEALAGREYLSLSSGEQRLILLVRAFVKSPELLILDEPFHGLDETNRQRARLIIDRYMRHKGRTLIMVTHYEEELPRCIDHHIHLVKHL